MELTPCPFCGKSKLLINTTKAGSCVLCEECNASGPLTDDESIAIISWNNRYYLDRMKFVDDVFKDIPKDILTKAILKNIKKNG